MRARDLPVADQACEIFEALLEPVLAAPSAAPGASRNGGAAVVRHGDGATAQDLTGLLGGVS